MTAIAAINVEFVPTQIENSEVNWKERLISFPVKIYKGFLNLLERIYNSALLILDVHFLRPRLTDVNLLRPVGRCLGKEPYISEVSTLAKKLHVTSDPEVMKEILKNYHNDPNGIFFGGRTMTIIIFDLFQALLPEEKVTREDFLLSCNPDNLKKYLALLNNFLSPSQIAKSAPLIQEIVAAELKAWENESNTNGSLNISEATKVYATKVVFKLIFGHECPLDDIKEIIHALDSLNQFIMGQFSLGKTAAETLQFTESDKKKMLDSLRKVIDSILKVENEGNDYLISRMKKDPFFTDAKIKIMIVTILMAGQETTAAVLAEAIRQLAQPQNHSYQDDVRAEIKQTGYDPSKNPTNIKLTSVENIFIEALRLHPAGYIIPRDASKNLTCVISDKKTNEVLKKHPIAKGEGVNACPYFAARNPDKFPEPNTFKPERHQGVRTVLSWLPFSHGVEPCPGQWLARNEIRLMLGNLLARFTLTTSQGEIGQKGLLTLKHKEDVKITLTPV